MRGLIILAALVLLLALVGWISFSDNEGHSSINLEKEAIKQDTREMLETGDDLIDRARTSAQEAVTDDEDVDGAIVSPDSEAVDGERSTSTPAPHPNTQ